MLKLSPQTVSAQVSPALVAAALDCLAFMPDGYKLEPLQLMAMTRAISGNASEAEALLVRIRAAAIVMCDPRWPKWSAVHKTQSFELRRAFDHAVLDVVAALPLDASLKFNTTGFFDAVLARICPRSQC
jgi:hypothetical protein